MGFLDPWRKPTVSQFSDLLCDSFSTFVGTQGQRSKETFAELPPEGLVWALFSNPNPYNLSEKYWQYTSNLYCSTPPFATLCLAGF